MLERAVQGRTPDAPLVTESARAHMNVLACRFGETFDLLEQAVGDAITTISDPYELYI